MNKGLPIVISLMLILLLTVTPAEAQTKASVSEATQVCLGCHAASTPGLTADWEKSRHAKVTPEEALKKGPLER